MMLTVIILGIALGTIIIGSLIMAAIFWVARKAGPMV